ncbi:3-oxoacyl-ACP synthase [Suicoccus acidiformans]|uniref:3-oxoacyl-ACP synthase n=1 Tax=Suicoccus acidiformans TaxID=2036206 RepID=A0A347WJD9_9LACT|nr:beta-ketoacyl-ACP synthase 3 [Suicoccus acidiformans]AXY25196.1 3-oxoacyl-ACP synthase [Suicoccus acidiformans]
MSRIIATGRYLPGKPIDNETFIKQTGIESSDEWIQQRSGISKRYFAREDETLADIATQAAIRALASLAEDIPKQIRRIIVATMSSLGQTPTIANQVQAKLGLEGAWCFDVSGACSGFAMAYDIAVRLAQGETEGYTLVIGAEKMSQILNFADRSTSFLFGDGAGAVVLKHGGFETLNYESEFHSMPDTSNSLLVQSQEAHAMTLAMDGREVFNFVYKTAIPSLVDFLKRTGDFDYLLCHQANRRFLELIERKGKIHSEQIPQNIHEVANISAASIPILLDSLVEGGQISLDGTQEVVLFGFGAGLSWGMVHTII